MGNVFITLGKILGPQWEQFHTSIKNYFIIGSIVAACILVAIYIYKKYKVELKDTALKIGNITLKIFHFFKRIEVLTACTAMISLGLIISLLVDAVFEEWL